jgi:hypothetical protein
MSVDDIMPNEIANQKGKYVWPHFHGLSIVVKFIWTEDRMQVVLH